MWKNEREQSTEKTEEQNIVVVLPKDKETNTKDDLETETHVIEVESVAKEDEGGWSTPSRTRKSPGRVTKDSKFGDVSILVNSRFSALSDKDENGEDVSATRTRWIHN